MEYGWAVGLGRNRRLTGLVFEGGGNTGDYWRAGCYVIAGGLLIEEKVNSISFGALGSMV
jgi:hypothetical protein